MSGYGDVAVGAVGLFVSGDANSVRAAWDRAAVHVFGPGSQAEKVCPRTAFLGLCAAGAVNGVPAGDYVAAAAANQEYSLTALELLREHGDEFETGRALWRAIGMSKTYNQQMDVVLALWRGGLLKRR